MQDFAHKVILCLCPFLSADLSLFRFITTELTRGYFLEHNEAKYTERRERVYTCLRIPKELEKVNANSSEIQYRCCCCCFTQSWKEILNSFFFSIFLADDVWLLPLSGYLSLCVHSASPKSDSGAFTTPHVALLWPQVNLICPCQWYKSKTGRPSSIICQF